MAIIGFNISYQYMYQSGNDTDDLYMENKCYLWDIAAGAAIVNAAGGEALILNQNEKFQVDVCFSNSLIKT